MSVEWPGWAKRRTWAVIVDCVREVNRRDVEPGTTAPCHTHVAQQGDGVALSEALDLGREEAERHQEAKRPKPHQVQGVVVRWQCQCKYDNSYIWGFDTDGMAEAIVDHIMTDRHTSAVAERRAEESALSDFMDALDIFE